MNAVAKTRPSLKGYARRDGRKGIRNVVAVAYLVECAHHVSREMVYPFREQGVHLLGDGHFYPSPPRQIHRGFRRFNTFGNHRHRADNFVQPLAGG